MAETKTLTQLSTIDVLFEDDWLVIPSNKTHVEAVRLFYAEDDSKIDVSFETAADNAHKIKLTVINTEEAAENRVKRYVVQLLVDGEWHDVFVKNHRKMPEWAKYRNPLVSAMPQARDYTPYISKQGGFKVSYKKFTHINHSERKLVFSGKLEDIVSTTDNLVFEISLKTMYPKSVDVINNVTLTYRGNDRTFSLQPESVKMISHNGRRNLIKATFNKAQISEDIYKDSYMLFVHATKDDQQIEYYINEVSKKYYEASHAPLRPVYQINDEKKFLIQVALNKNLWIHYRDMQELDLPHVLETEAKALKTYKPNQKNGNILMFEKEGQMAQDNAFALFKYLQTTDIKDKVFYVINEHSDQKSLLDPWKDQVLLQYSEEYYKHVIEDEMIVTSESLPHIYQFNMVYGNIIDIIRGKRNYFLQHGVIGIRKLGDVFSYKKSGFDYFNASTKHEKEVVTELLGYPQERINVLGLPRWDALEIDSKEASKTVVYFPTWREYLAYLTDDEFVESEYFQQIKNVIESEYLQAKLAESGYHIKVFLHPKMRKFTGHFNAQGNIEVVDSSQVALNALIKECDAVISDYSSMVWDFAYQRKPVVLFQFDQESYEERWGGFFDKSIWDFGPIVKTVDELNGVMDKLIQRDMKIEDKYRQNIDGYLGDLDNISEKHYDLIQQILAKKFNFKLSKTTYPFLKQRYLRRYLKKVLRVIRAKVK